jgi:hypothetical protein
MNQLHWLIGRRFESLVAREGDWLFAFDSRATLSVLCLWRLLENGRIERTSDDHGHQFGLPAPVDAAEACNRLLAKKVVSDVALREGTLDITIRFESGHVLEIIPNSAGYEAWGAYSGTEMFHAIGGGEIFSYRDRDADTHLGNQ